MACLNRPGICGGSGGAVGYANGCAFVRFARNVGIRGAPDAASRGRSAARWNRAPVAV
jgi:hypothetical protein